MRIGVFCSGGDAPGMNPCVRAVVRSTLAAGHEAVGIYRGYHGLLHVGFNLAAIGGVMAFCLTRMGPLHWTDAPSLLAFVGAIQLHGL